MAFGAHVAGCDGRAVGAVSVKAINVALHLGAASRRTCGSTMSVFACPAEIGSGGMAQTEQEGTLQ